MSAGGDDGPAVFDSAELLVRLADVDAELPGDEHIEIAVIGGAAITFLRAGRVTNDVDVISEGMPQTLRDAAARVASRHALRTDWINDAAKIGLPRLEPQLETIYRGERLTVHRAGPKYLLATKLNAGRPVDIEDAVHLAIAAGVTTREGMLDLLETAFPAAMLTPRVQYTAETGRQRRRRAPATRYRPLSTAPSRTAHQPPDGEARQHLGAIQRAFAAGNTGPGGWRRQVTRPVQATRLGAI